MSQQRAAVEIYRWRCPICGESGVRVIDSTAGGVPAVETLRNHVLFTDADGHGPAGRLPDGYDADALAACVGT